MMKYVKLFESWLNEAEATKIAIPKEFQTSEFIGTTKPISLGDKINLQYSVSILDIQNASNKNVLGGITIDSSIFVTNSGFSMGKWTLDPMNLLMIVDKKDQAATIKKEILDGLKRISEQYGLVLNSYQPYEMVYRGKLVKYYSPKGADVDFEMAKKTLDENQIKTLKESLSKGRVELEKLLAKIEKDGKDILSQEIKSGSPLPTGMKLIGAMPKDTHVQNFYTDPSHWAERIKEWKSSLSNEKWIGERKMMMNLILSGLAYAYAKCDLIERLANDPDLYLKVVGTYGNTDNKFLAQITEKWPQLKDMAKKMGAKESELDKYAPKATAAQKQP